MKQLTKDQIDAIFDYAEDQADYVFGLYEAVIDNWDDVEEIKGHPTVNETTSRYIYDQAGKFDREHHPDVFAGGAWMNRGFSTDFQDEADIPNWRVSLQDCEIKYSN